MSSAISRLGDSCTGHGNFPPRTAISGSGDVFINNRAVLTIGSNWEPHTDGLSVHSGVSVSGSGTVFVNNKAIVRVGDSIDCGSKVASGSGNVFAGG